VSTTATLHGFVHDEKPANKIEHAGQQAEDEAAPLLGHEGVDDLECATDEQARTDHERARDGNGADIEPGDHT
jgi:hypothetical protein